MLDISIFTQGGYSMVGILIASIAALTEIIYCFFILRRKIVLPANLIEVAEGKGKGKDLKSAAAICQQEGGPFAEILLAAISGQGSEKQEIQNLVESAGRRAAHFLSRGVLVLEVIAAVAPLLGLLGTVIGMQDAFSDIARTGVKQMGSLPAGISKALITTITGLVVAIPAFIFYSYFQRRVDELIMSMERYTIHMLARLNKEKSA